MINIEETIGEILNITRPNYEALDFQSLIKLIGHRYAGIVYKRYKGSTFVQIAKETKNENIVRFNKENITPVRVRQLFTSSLVKLRKKDYDVYLSITFTQYIDKEIKKIYGIN